LSFSRVSSADPAEDRGRKKIADRGGDCGRQLRIPAGRDEPHRDAFKLGGADAGAENKQKQRRKNDGSYRISFSSDLT
jgi:hypothetical protein